MKRGGNKSLKTDRLALEYCILFVILLVGTCDSVVYLPHSNLRWKIRTSEDKLKFIDVVPIQLLIPRLIKVGLIFKTVLGEERKEIKLLLIIRN